MMSASTKSMFKTEDPISAYVHSHSLIRLHPLQHKLIEETLKLPETVRIMLGDPEVVQLNELLMRSLNAKKVVDVGVFTGMSALAAALALPDDGKILACDVSEEFTSIAKKYWEEAGVAHKVELHLKPAVDTLQEALDKGEDGTYDFAFIDADKPNYTNYYELCLKLIRKGGIIVVDNVFWSGGVADESCQDERCIAVRKLNDLIVKDDRVHMTMQKIGDGLTICVKK